MSKTTTDHDAIRKWAEERGGWPAQVASTEQGGRTGIVIDFPGYTGEGKLERISWDDWFRKFDDSGLAFVYEEATAGGQRSSFNKLVRREMAGERRERAQAAPTAESSKASATGERAGRKTRPRTSGVENRGGRRTQQGARRQTSRATAARTAERSKGRGKRGASKTPAKPGARKSTGHGGRRTGGGRASRRPK